MPIQLQDAGIRSVFSQMQARAAANTGYAASDAEVLELLAKAADSSSLSGAAALAKLKTASSAQGVARLVQPGLTATERADLAAVLDAGDVKLAPTARVMLEAVLGRDAFGATPSTPGAPTVPSGPTPTSPTASGEWFSSGKTPADFLSASAGKASTVSAGGQRVSVEAGGAQVRLNGGAPVPVAADGSFLAMQALPGFGGPVPVQGSVKSDGSIELKVPTANGPSPRLERVFLPGTTATRSAALEKLLSNSVGTSAAGVASTSVSAVAVHATMLSKDLIRVRVGDADAVMRLGPDGSFGSREPLASPIAGRFSEGGLELLVPHALKLGLGTPLPSTVTDANRGLAQALTAHYGASVDVPLTPVGAFKVTAGRLELQVHTPSGRNVTVPLMPDGSFSMVNGADVLSGSLRANGEVVITQAAGQGMSAKPSTLRLTGPTYASSALTETDLQLWQATGRVLVDQNILSTGYPRVVVNGTKNLTVEYLIPGAGASIGSAPVVVQADGSFSATTNSGRVTGVLSGDGRALVNVPGQAATSTFGFPQPVGPFTWTWREEDLVGVSSTGNGWVELAPGSANKRALKEVFDLMVGDAVPLAALLPPLVVFDRFKVPTEADRQAFRVAVDALLRRTDLPADKQAAVAKLRATRDDVALNAPGFAAGKMGSEALTWLEARAPGYPRGRPIAAHDTAGRARLSSVLDAKVGAQVESAFAQVQVLPNRELLVKFGGELRRVPVNNDGTFGLRSLRGAELTGYIGTTGQVVLQSGRDRAEVGTFRAGTPLPTPPPVEAVVPYVPVADTRAALDAKVGYEASAATPPLQVRLNGRDSLTVMLRGESMTAHISPNGTFSGTAANEYVTGSINPATGVITFRGTPDMAKLPPLTLAPG